MPGTAISSSSSCLRSRTAALMNSAAPSKTGPALPLKSAKRSKRAAGKDFPVIIKLSAEEKVPGGLTISDTKILSRYLEEAGYDAIEATICTYASLDWMSAPEDVPMGFNAYNAKEIRESVHIPVIAIDRINTPEIAEDILETGKADFVSISPAVAG